MLTCDKCSGQIPEGAKFCPHCADPVTKADLPTQIISTNEPAKAVITFGFSSSANYSKALSLCEKIKSYKKSGEGKQMTHVVELLITDAELIDNIFSLVGSWRSSSLIISGKKCSKSDLTYKGIGCFRKRQQSLNLKQYCYGDQSYDYNVWGCKKLNMGILWGEWLSYGNFDSNRVWHFDKKRIKNELQNQVHENDLCPVLKKENIFKVLEELPDTINPKADPRWEYETQLKQFGDDFKNIAVGIRPILNKINSFVIDDFTPTFQEDEDYKSYNFDNSSSIPDSESKINSKNKSNTRHLVFGIVFGILFILLIGFCSTLSL